MIDANLSDRQNTGDCRRAAMDQPGNRNPQRRRGTVDPVIGLSWRGFVGFPILRIAAEELPGEAAGSSLSAYV